jgi:cation diffusion facilitator family transporter
MTNPESFDRKNFLAVNLSLAANVLLAVLKTGVGIVGHSQALLADGINSTSDVVYLAIVRAFMRLAGKPPDREHPYGHRQLESIAAVVVGAFVMSTAVVIFWNAVNQVFDLATGRAESRPVRAVALWVALLTVILKLGLTVLTGRISRKTGSLTVLALSRDHRNDIFSIAAAGVGIFFARFGHVWVDPLAAALVALVILHTGVTILRESSADLMVILPDRKVAERIRQLLKPIAGIEQVEEIHVQRIGPYLLVNLTVGIDGTLTVAAGDQIATQVEDALWRNVDYIRRVSVHYHPSQMQPL